MKKLLLFGATAFFTQVFAQTFSDDFESYTVGAYLGTSSPKWTTWTASQQGASEDVKITDTKASSGTKSIYFASALANGGPQDVILPFDQVYNSGNFTFEANFFVEANKGAYFNLQGTNVPGEVWALDCYMLNNGTLKLKNQATSYLTANYPPAQWFNLRVEMNLTSNIWELFVNNVSQGTFANPTGKIGILDIYPVNPTSEGGNGNAGFYVDDVSYNYISPNLPQRNGGITFVEQLGPIAGMNSDVKATVRNLGSDAITSFDIEYTLNSVTDKQTITGLNLASLATYDYTFPAKIATAPGTLTVTISNVNGAGVDADAADDSKSITSSPVVPAQGKMVVSEEGTGTWCQYCPRGAVYMDLYAENFHDFWTGIAVHNGDPMTVTAYDTGLGQLFSGLPSAVVDRGTDVDPSGMYSEFISRLQQAPKAFITNGATWDATSRKLNVSVTADFKSGATNAYKLACVLVEDSVTGTSSSYNQSNAYANNANGPMGGFESLPNPVPAAQMNYNHVARAIAPSFTGEANSFPAVVNTGETHTLNFEFTLPAGWDANQISIVGLLLAPDGRIDNAGRATIDQAVTNGFVSASNLSVTELLNDELGKQVTVYPNPATDVAMVRVNEVNQATVSIVVFDLSGKQLAARTFENQTGALEFPVITSNFEAGIYMIDVQVGQERSIKRLVIE